MRKKDLGFYTSQQYFTAMEKISKEVRKTLIKIFEKIVSEFELKEFNGLWREGVLKMWKIRVLKNENPKYLRPLLVLMGYKFIKDEENILTPLPQKLIDIATAAELLNIATYQVNIAIDRKSGIETEEDRITQFLLADITLSKCIETILESKISHLTKEKLITCYLLCNNMTKHEQFININILKIENWFLVFRENYNLWEKVYMHRILCAGGYTIAYALFSGGIIAMENENKDEKILNTLWNIGLLLGKSLQLVNDIGDLIGDLPYKPIFADYKNGLLTFPLFWVLKCLKEEGKEELEKEVIERKLPAKDIVKMFIEYEGLKEGEKLLEKDFKKIKELCKKHLDENSKYFLSNVYNLIFNNKFFKKLREIKYA